MHIRVTQTQIDLDMVIFWQREVDMDIHTQAVVSCWGPASTCGQAEVMISTCSRSRAWGSGPRSEASRLQRHVLDSFVLWPQAHLICSSGQLWGVGGGDLKQKQRTWLSSPQA